MKMIKSMSRVSMVAALGFGLAFSAPAFTYADADPAAKLVESLKALNIGEVDYLYAYLQSVELTDSEYNSIVANAEEVAKVLEGASHPDDLPTAEKTKLVNLFLESAQKAHLNVSFVDSKGNKIDLTSGKYSASDLLVQIKDLKGNVLASINPSIDDLQPAAIQAKVNALKTAVDAKVELDKDGKFNPMPSAELPDTSTDLPLGIALGSLIVVLGGAALIPAAKVVRKLEA